MGDLSERIKNLSPEQRELFMRKLKKMETKDDIKKIVVTLQGGNSTIKNPLFCFHPPIGAVGYHINITRHLNPDQPVYGIQSPAFCGVRDPFDNMEEMAAYYIEAMKLTHPEGPYLLAGHSSAAYIAYEIALQLEKNDIKVPLLIVIDGEAPTQNATPDQSIMEILKREDLYESVEAMYFTTWAVSLAHGKPLTFSMNDLAPLSNDRRYQLIADYLKAAGFLPQNAGSEMVGTIMKMYNYHSRADESYIEKYTKCKPESRFKGKLVILRCTESTTYEGFGITEAPDTSEFSGWEKFCVGPIDLLGIPNSNHITIIIEPCVKLLAEKMQPYLDEFFPL